MMNMMATMIDIDNSDHPSDWPKDKNTFDKNDHLTGNGLDNNDHPTKL